MVQTHNGMKIIKLMSSTNKHHSYSLYVKLKDNKFSAQLERWIGSEIRQDNLRTFKTLKEMLHSQEFY